MKTGKKAIKIILCILAIISPIAGYYIYNSPTLIMMFNNKMNSESLKKYSTEVGDNITLTELNNAIQKGVDHLFKIQNDGAWEKGHAGVSALCLKAIMQSPGEKNKEQEAIIAKGLNYLISLQQTNGSFHINFSISSAMNNYNTSLIILALLAAPKDYSAELKKAQDYLIGVQNGDIEGDVNSGGIGYGGEGAPDLSNLQVALEALHESGVDSENEVFKNAKKFILHCQDSEGNDQSWAGSSGGFIYKPTALNKDGKPEPYGAMTFAGLKSLIFCSVDSDDESVKDALRWIGANYNISEHPGKGQVGLFYYYYTLSKALSVAEVDNLKLANGEDKNWRADLAKEILKRQNQKGGWRNPQKKYLEGISALSTAYAIASLNIISKDWAKTELKSN